MTLEELKDAIQTGDVESVDRFIGVEANVLSTKLECQDKVENHNDESGSWTSLERVYFVKCNETIIYSWWEKYCGYYGCGGTGWWVENIDANGPTELIKNFLRRIGLNEPPVVVPQPDH